MTDISAAAPPVEAAVAPEAGEVPVTLRIEGLSKRYAPPGRTLWSRLTFLHPRGEAVDDEDDELDEEEDEEEERRAGAERWALRDLDLVVGRGVGVGVVGPHGSGKSTLARILGRVVVPTAGRAEVHGRTAAFVGKIGIFLQPNRSIRENAVLAARLRGFGRAEVEPVLRDVFAFAKLQHGPREPLKVLSGGQQWRLVVSTLLHLDVALYVVDSDVGAGDVAFRDRCLDLLAQRRAEGVTILQTGTNVDDVRRLCDRVVWLENGRRLAEGTPDEVEAWLAARQVFPSPRAEHVAAAASDEPSAPAPTADSVRLLGFLELAVGETRAEQALARARAAAAEAHAARVRWTDLARAAELDLDETRAIVDRLAARVGRDGTSQPTAAASIVDARVVSPEGEPTAVALAEDPVALEVVVDVGEEVELAVAVSLTGDGGLRRPLRQPTPFAALPGRYRVRAVVPAGALPEGRWRASIGVGSGQAAPVVRREALSFRVAVDLEEPEAKETIRFDAFDPVDADELDEAWAGEPDPIEVEWQVRHERAA